MLRLSQTTIAGILLGGAVLTVAGCAAVQTTIAHSELDVQSKMTNTIFLDPVAQDQRIIFIQAKNSSDQPGLDLAPAMVQAMTARGYRVVENPEQAHYQLQINVLQVGRSSPSAAEQALAGGYGSIWTTANTAASIGATNSANSGVAAGLVGTALATVADAAVKNVTYSIVTDLQLSERSAQPVLEQTVQSLEQGRSGRRNIASQEITNWKRYQTRIVSTANKVNLDLNEAVPVLTSGMTRSIAGIF